MSLNLYSLIIQAAEENNIDVNLEVIGKINDSINNLIARNISPLWIENNLEILF
ncbi:hypothetical protein [Clostridium beijerinckii]|uniref:Uncharacterized protein n=1 Tax=Clostridium beijerinckii TaxID=1520 RepID=A0AAX0B928_CLOBE|nr:hypothetical protein [Clostridium beijerinckii]NRT88902.1 hypothetical protein [Clostridium beijerinckii]NRT91482.1 hypothetical protein [Clostridium beijerinckii]NYC71007.1 hypothetical protein [Clostridium beijerinckii]NYC74357.1 hypothetical protein [Clostridium beijerinckii]